MKELIESIKIIKSRFRDNEYSQSIENSIDEQEDFFQLQKQLFDCFKIVYASISRKKIDVKQTNRINNTINLNEELEYYSDYSDPSTTEYVESLALFTEITNNMAHIIESGIKNNDLTKNKDLRTIKNLMYDIKTIALDKIAKATLNKENEGIIVGTETDDYKSVNNKVLVLDLPRYGQLSWHYGANNDIYKQQNYLSKLPTYRYEIQKGVMDSRETSLNSKLLLGQGHVNDLNIHNKIDREIPFGHEDELKLALDIYYDILNNKDEYATYESKLRSACLRHGMPSKETFNMILDKVMDTMYGKLNYEKDELKKWRDNIEHDR